MDNNSSLGFGRIHFKQLNPFAHCIKSIRATWKISGTQNGGRDEGFPALFFVGKMLEKMDGFGMKDGSRRVVWLSDFWV